MAEMMDSDSGHAPAPKPIPPLVPPPDRLPDARDFLRRGVPLPRGLVVWLIAEVGRLRTDLECHRESDADRPCGGPQ